MTLPTSWTRLEPLSRNARLDGALRAEIHDPLWLLARQWQHGEFAGEDAGSPVLARLTADCTPITRYWLGRIDADGPVVGHRLDAGVPLETVVEQEPVRVNGASQPRLAAEAGVHFLRLLSRAGAGAHRAAIVARFPLSVPLDETPDSTDGETRRFLRVVAGRVPNGQLLYTVLKAVLDPSSVDGGGEGELKQGVEAWQAWLQTLGASDRNQVENAVAQWMSWYERLFSEPGTSPPGRRAWISERMEYELAAAAPTPDTEIVMTAREYVEGHLDWYSFNVYPHASLGAKRSDLAPEDRSREQGVHSAIAVPVSFRGMPAARLWEFEDARVDFGAIEASPQELVRLLLIDFALIYANDWFYIPLELPLGSVVKIDSLVVRDTFGQATLIRPARQVDELVGEQLSWDLFGLSPDPRYAARSDERPHALFLPPVLGASLHGPTLEEIVFLRDEMANMAWAVERIVETPIGRPHHLAEAFHRRRREEEANRGAPTPVAPADGVWIYRLATPVPDHWIPLFPDRIAEAEPAVRFERGGTPRGRILEPERSDANPLFVDDEEVPRAGATVTRAFQYTRWTDGSSHLWIGRRKGAGRGEGSSGLRFDVLVPSVGDVDAADVQREP